MSKLKNYIIAGLTRNLGSKHTHGIPHQVRN